MVGGEIRLDRLWSGAEGSGVDECRLCMMMTCWPRAVVKEGSRSL